MGQLRFCFSEIDQLAEEYHSTRNCNLEGQFITKLDPYLHKVSNLYFARFVNFNTQEDWFQELRIESLRLFRHWVPKNDLKFNYLLRCQIGNFCVNSYAYVTAQKRNQLLEKDIDIALLSPSLTQDFTKELEARDLIEKLLKYLKGPERQILNYLAIGAESKEIRLELKISATTISSFKKRARGILLALQNGGFNGEINEKSSKEK